jgi:hypothetical protein
MCQIVYSSPTSLFSVCTMSTVVEALSIILDQLVFDSLAFVMQQLWQQEKHLVSKHPFLFFCSS